MRLGIIGLQTQGLPVAGDRFLELPLSLQGNPQVVVRLGKLWMKAKSLLNVIDGQVVSADLMSDHAEQMQGIDMARLDLQDLPVKLLRLKKVARLVVSHRQAQPLR